MTATTPADIAKINSIESAAKYLKIRIAEIIADETPECEMGTENCEGTDDDLVVSLHPIGDSYHSCKCCGIGYWY